MEGGRTGRGVGKTGEVKGEVGWREGGREDG